MVYKTLKTDFYYEDSGITSLTYYIAADDVTIYTGRAYNPKGIKINVRDAIDDWLVNEMPDFRTYNDVMVVHPDAYKVFYIYEADGTLLEEYRVFLTYEDIGIQDITNRCIDGKADPRQKIFVGTLSESASTVDIDARVKNPQIEFDKPFWFEYQSGTTIVCYTANTDYTLSSYDGGWFTVSQTKADEFTGCLTFTYTENENRYQRNGTMCMTFENQFGETAVTCFPVGQEMTSSLVFSIYNGYIGPSGGIVRLKYDTNYFDNEIYFTADAGVNIVSHGSGYLVVSVPANPDDTFRDFNVYAYRVDDGQFLDDAKVVQASSYAHDYLTIEPIESGFILLDYSISTGVPIYTIYISRDDGLTWEAVNTTHTYPGTKINVTSGNDILIKGYNETNWIDYSGQTGTRISFEKGYWEDPVYGGEWFPSAKFKLKGNIMSLVYGDDFRDKDTLVSGGTFHDMFYDCSALTSTQNLVLPAINVSEDCYNQLFYGCTNLVTPPEILPASDLTGADGCYAGMFEYCTSLGYCPQLPATKLSYGCYGSMFARCSSIVTAPELPAQNLARYCYGSMFANCSSLVTGPSELPATVLQQECYEYMFQNCSALSVPPVIRATTLAQDCCAYMFRNCSSMVQAPVLRAPVLAEASYYWMFNGCSLLESIECRATDISANDCTHEWVGSVKATGVFKKAASMTGWTTGNSGIPSGWTVQDAV